MKMKLYISGAISNNPDYKKQFTSKYMELEASGKYIVLSPLFINAPDLSYEDFMHIDYAMIDVCDAIYLMKGWENSYGANLEKQYSEIHYKKIIYEE